jgi:hypothetical protein
MFGRFVKFRQEKFGGVLFETQKERVFTLNETGAEIARCIQEGKTTAEIVAHMRDRFEGDPAEIAREVREFLEELRRQGFIGDGDA